MFRYFGAGRFWDWQFRPIARAVISARREYSNFLYSQLQRDSILRATIPAHLCPTCSDSNAAQFYSLRFQRIPIRHVSQFQEIQLL